MKTTVFRLPEQDRIAYASQFRGRRTEVVHSPLRTQHQEQTLTGVIVAVGLMYGGQSTGVIALREDSKAWETFISLAQVRSITPGILDCGCPAQIVNDEGHQEGCDVNADRLTQRP